VGYRHGFAKGAGGGRPRNAGAHDRRGVEAAIANGRVEKSSRETEKAGGVIEANEVMQVAAVAYHEALTEYEA
jgi:hypothetical protein